MVDTYFLGFSLEENTCADRDECAADTTLCSATGQECLNTHGSYTCGCASGFVEEVAMVNMEPVTNCVWPEWSEWTEWSNDCQVDEGEGIRQRSCSVQLPNNGCVGETTETRTCSK